MVVGNLGTARTRRREREIAWERCSTADADPRRRGRPAPPTSCCSPTPRAPPAGPRAPCTPTPASSSRPRARSPTRSTSRPGGVFCWITDMGWIMGPLSIIGTHANGGTLLLYEGSPDVPDVDRLWRSRRAPPGDDARRLADADPHPARQRLARRRRDADLSVGPHDRVDRRAVGPGVLRLAGRATCSAAGCRSSTSPAAPRSAAPSSRPYPVETDPQLLARRPVARHGRRRRRRRGPLAARRDRRAGLPPALAGDDPRRLERRAALPRGLLVDVSRACGATATSPWSTPTASGSSSAAPTT